jgi:hypothetical protein
MKIILKLLVVGFLINASVRGGIAALRYYELKDTAQQAVLFGATNPPEAIRQRILQKAEQLQIPLAPDDLLVQRQGGRTWADAAYRQPIELFPNQKYPIDFSFSVEGYSMVLGQ